MYLRVHAHKDAQWRRRRRSQRRSSAVFAITSLPGEVQRPRLGELQRHGAAGSCAQTGGERGGGGPGP